MKRNLIVGACALLVALCFTVPAVVTGQEGKDQALPDMEEMMKAYEQAGMPGPEHKLLCESVGSWVTEGKCWMAPGEPETSHGVSEVKALFDGRFIMERYRGQFMGRAFEGIGIVGYDNVKKKYVSVWMDNMSTCLMMSEGTRDAATKTTTLFGVYEDPFKGPVKMKSVVREISKDKHVFEMYSIQPDGSEHKDMEWAYTRK